MNMKSTFFAAMSLLVMAANCHSQKKPIKTYSFPFADENGEFVLEVEVSEGQPRTEINVGTKIIEVKKEGMLIGRMESMRLPDYNIGEGLQFIEQEDNLLRIQQSSGGGRYITIFVFRFEYSAGKMLLNNFELSSVDRIAEVQDLETHAISIQGSIDMNEIDDEVIDELIDAIMDHEKTCPGQKHLSSP